MAFVVPAEIGHAPYAQPVLKHLAGRISHWVQVIAIRRKLFPDLSEDCWLLYCDGFGGRTDRFALSILSAFTFREVPPEPDLMISLKQWQEWGCRLRLFSCRPTCGNCTESWQTRRIRCVWGPWRGWELVT